MDSCMCNIHKNKWSKIINGKLLLDRQGYKQDRSYDDSISFRNGSSGKVYFTITSDDLEVKIASPFVFRCSLEAKDTNGNQLLYYLGTSNEYLKQYEENAVREKFLYHPLTLRPIKSSPPQDLHCFTLKIKRDRNDDNAEKLWDNPLENLVFCLELLFDAEVAVGRVIDGWLETCHGYCREQRVHMDHLMQAMKNSSEEESRQTVTLRVGDDVEIVNKVILSTCSPVFARMFETPMKEQQEESVTIKDLDIKVVQNIISFAYIGKVGKLNVEELLELYYAAEKYQIPGLLKLCSDLILSQISCDNMCNLLQFAESYEDERLKSGVLSYMILNIHSVLEHEKWRSLLKEKPKLALQVFESPYKEQLCEKKEQIMEQANDSQSEYDDDEIFLYRYLNIFQADSD